MLKITEANGAELTTNMTIQEFQSLMVTAQPSSWVSIVENRYGTMWLNTFTIAYYFEV